MGVQILPWERAILRGKGIVLDGGPEMLRDVAVATNCGIKTAINWLCVNDGLGDWLWRGCEWSDDRMQIFR